MDKITEKIYNFGIIPVVAIEDAKDAAHLGRALLAGGLSCAEITFRTTAARASIQTLASQFSEMLVGAGTVLTVEQAQIAVDHGAQFLVTPGFDEIIVEWCLQNDVPIFPGVATPTEINLALRYGLKTLKFFPAQAMGGVATLKAIAGPYGAVQFIPTGGVSPHNLPDYLALPSVLACGGSWVAKKTLIASGEFETITQLTAEAVKIVTETRA